MSESIVLTRPLAMQGWRTVGLIARAERREEFEPVLLRASMDGTDAEDIADHLLVSRSRKVVAERLLRMATVFGLLEDNHGRYTLTERGGKAIADGKVFVPEYGTWNIWVSGDPLLPSPVLRIDAANEPGAYIENREYRDAENKQAFHELPEEIHENQGTEVTPPVSDDGISVRIDELGKKAEAIDSDESLTLIWKVQERELRLQGKWGGKTVDSELEAPGKAPDEIWAALLAGRNLSDYWDRQRGALRVSFRETAEEERESMSRDVRFPTPSVPGFGQFDSLVVPRVDIAALSDISAQEWAIWRFRKRIRDFATSKRCDEWWKEAAEPFAGHCPDRPSRNGLAREAWGAGGDAPSTQAWHLMAAEDWRL